MIVGVGNRFRGDDGAGLAVAARLRELLPGARVIEREGNLARLLDDWVGEDAVIIVDATSSRSPPGTVRCFDAHVAPLPAGFVQGSTHAFGVAESVELGRALGRLPPRVLVYGIEGSRFDAGEGLTPPVAVAVASVVDTIRLQVAAKSFHACAVPREGRGRSMGERWSARTDTET